MRDSHFVARHRAAPNWEATASQILGRVGAEWEFGAGTYVGRRRAASAIQIQYATVVATAVIAGGVIALGSAAAMPDEGPAPSVAGPPAVVAVVQDGQAGGEESVVQRTTATVATRGVDRTPLKSQPAEEIWTSPLKNGEFDLTSFFGQRWGVLHAGIDLAAPTGTPVYAAHRGTVVEAGWAGTYGYLVVIDHGKGLSTYYAHNSALSVSAGDKVEAGDPISKVGNTGYSFGPHSHFEVHLNGEKVDPMPYLKKRGLDVAKAAENVYPDDSLLPG
ncbi:M23 family metallopeptidase [Phytomonospora sp. NPDC050363]|uniref:M23 family metallopeptidase n=1 Tax=Phytomonospora sp. NPDC050363 TaxID=3155642 RepID=UPI0033DFEE16